MHTIGAQKVTQCFRKYKKPEKLPENPIHNTFCQLSQVYPQFIEKKMVKLLIFHGIYGM